LGDYFAPGIAGMLHFSPETFMMIVSVIEIIAGELVLNHRGSGCRWYPDGSP